MQGGSGQGDLGGGGIVGGPVLDKLKAVKDYGVKQDKGGKIVVTEKTGVGTALVWINLFAVFQIILCEKYSSSFRKWSGSESCSVGSAGCACSAPALSPSGSLLRNISFDLDDLLNDPVLSENVTTNRGGYDLDFGNLSGNESDDLDFDNFGGLGNFGGNLSGVNLSGNESDASLVLFNDDDDDL